MRVEYINPFIKSTLNLFKTMIGMMPTQGKPYVKTDDSVTHDVSGIIGLTGQASGSVVLSFSTSAALKIAGAFMGTEVTELNQDVTDAIGEMTNMVSGGAKAELNKFGFNISISIPSIVIGREHRISKPKDVPCVMVPFTTEFGDFSVEVSLKTPK